MRQAIAVSLILTLVMCWMVYGTWKEITIPVIRERPIWAKEGLIAKYYLHTDNYKGYFRIYVLKVYDNYANLVLVPEMEGLDNIYTSWSYGIPNAFVRTKDNKINDYEYDNRTYLLSYAKIDENNYIRMVEQYV